MGAGTYRRKSRWRLCEHPRVPGNTARYSTGSETCLTCSKEKNTRRMRSPGHRTRRWHRNGIDRSFTYADYGRMREQQAGRCLICPELPPKRLVPDHDHKTGRVRGLLCDSCNKGLGCFRDSVASLQRAITYLEGGLVA